MAIRSKEEILDMIRQRVGDDTSDDAIKIIEDVSDTLDDYDVRIADSGDWKARYEENDAAWRARYKERFFTRSAEDVDEPEMIDEPEEIEIKSFEELFTTEEG